MTKPFNLDALAKLLAVEMTARTGELWRAVINDHITHIESESACLSLSDHWKTQRLTIHATAPQGMREPRTGETITADPQRKPEAIAADICSRILTHAREHLAESKGYDAQQARVRNAKQLRARMIQKYLPTEYQNEKFCSSKDAGKYKQRVYAHVTYENLINIEVTLPLPEALKLLEQLTKE
jgi:hypothetical protein